MITHPLRDISFIKQMMERNSKFLGISGVGGIASGSIAMLTLVLYFVLSGESSLGQLVSFNRMAFASHLERIITLAGICFFAAFTVSFYFISRKSNKLGISVFSSISKRVFVNIAVPMIVGGMLLVKICLLHFYELLMPVSLIFYGIGLLGAARSTFKEVYYLAASFLAMGCVALFLPGYAFLYWAVGFGMLHIIFGAVIRSRYEKK